MKRFPEHQLNTKIRRSRDVTALSRPFLTAMAPGVSLTVGDALTRGDGRFPRVLAGLLESGDAFLRRTKLHAGADGHLDEEFHRDSGYMQGARDLTWSYASFVTAEEARAAAKKAMGR